MIGSGDKPHQVIFINGPRHSGKDTAAKFIMLEYPVQTRIMKFAHPLKEACRSLFNIPDDLYRQLEELGGDKKLEPLKELDGRSWVDTLIWLSERVVKPEYGNEFFGKRAAELIKRRTMCQLTVFADSGFQHEAQPVIDVVGPKNAHQFQLYRPGCSFDGDSRSYWLAHTIPLPNCHTIKNEHELRMFRLQILTRVDRILGIEVAPR